MAVRKEYRDLTVGDIYRNGKSVPMLRVSGLWLEELGFKTGDFVRIKCEDGQLIISLNEEKAQEKAAEKSFMDEEMKKLRKRYQREGIDFLGDTYMVTVGDVILVSHTRYNAETLLQALGELVCGAFQWSAVDAEANICIFSPLITFGIHVTHDL